MTPKRRFRLTALAAAVMLIPMMSMPIGASAHPVPRPSTAGTFERLSPGNQKIARALFEAQPAPSGPRRLTLDQIAAMKRTGRGWGDVFKDMKARGLVEEKNLGQVVSRHERAHGQGQALARGHDRDGHPDRGVGRGPRDHGEIGRVEQRLEHRDRFDRGGPERGGPGGGHGGGRGK